MKRSKTIFAAIICGVVCAASVLAFTHSVRGEAEASRAEALSRFGGEQIEVCTATRDISPGETINSTNSEMRLWIADLLPEGAIRTESDAIGQQAATLVLEGEVITERRFSNGESRIDVPVGLSALSIPVKDVQAVGGSVGEGMRIDLYATGQSSTELIAERVLVLASSAEGSTSTSSQTAWVTLGVEAESVQEIISASQQLELSIVLPGSDREGNK